MNTQQVRTANSSSQAVECLSERDCAKIWRQTFLIGPFPHCRPLIFLAQRAMGLLSHLGRPSPSLRLTLLSVLLHLPSPFLLISPLFRYLYLTSPSLSTSPHRTSSHHLHLSHLTTFIYLTSPHLSISLHLTSFIYLTPPHYIHLPHFTSPPSSTSLRHNPAGAAASHERLLAGQVRQIDKYFSFVLYK
jgi:hypothetical protein